MERETNLSLILPNTYSQGGLLQPPHTFYSHFSSFSISLLHHSSLPLEKLEWCSREIEKPCNTHSCLCLLSLPHDFGSSEHEIGSEVITSPPTTLHLLHVCTSRGQCQVIQYPPPRSKSDHPAYTYPLKRLSHTFENPSALVIEELPISFIHI